MDRVTSSAATESFAAKLGRILGQTSDMILLVDAATLRLVHANEGARHRLRLDEADGELSVLDLLPQLNADAFARLVAPLRDGSRDQVTLRTPCGRRGAEAVMVDLHLHLAADEDPPLLAALAFDVGDESACDIQLRRTSRAMTALTRATEALIHATDWLHLLDEVCRIVVEVGGYRLAWVGWVRHDEQKSVEPVAKCGYETDYVQHIRVTWADNELGLGPSGTAIRTRRPQVARNTATEATFVPWRDAAMRHGFASVLSLPLIVQDDVVGVLNIYSGEVEAFDADEMRLLEDLARNLAYGIGTLRAEQQRRRAETELKESEARYRALVELSPDAILAHRKGRIVFANAAAHRVFRTPDGQTLVGRHLLELLPVEERAAAAQRLDATPVGQLSEETMIRLDGESFAAEMTAAEIVYHGVPTNLMMLRDVTDRRQVQDQLVQTAKLATLGEMAAGMAHELSQPLNIIRMAAEGALMLIDRGRADGDYKRKQFQLISDQTRRMAEIIDHIRIFSRKDTGAVEAFDAATAVRLAIELFERQLAGDEILLSVSYPSRPCPVVGRPVQLEQVVMNLLANAADSLREKRQRLGDDSFRGKLEVVTTCSEELGVVLISVSDNGVGIQPQALERVFEPFFTTKEIGRGTGLGLSVSFGIVASMSGRIDACNNKEGASFVITLPMSKAAVETRPPATLPETRAAASAATVGGEHHLLIVDDEPEAAAAMAYYLREHGYRVSTAANGNEAWERFQADPAAVVVTDLRMPNGDGRELLARLRGYDPLLPVVVVTGHMGTTERLSDDNIDDELAVVLTKPVSLQMLVETIEQFLQS